MGTSSRVDASWTARLVGYMGRLLRLLVAIATTDRVEHTKWQSVYSRIPSENEAGPASTLRKADGDRGNEGFDLPPNGKLLLST